MYLSLISDPLFQFPFLKLRKLQLLPRYDIFSKHYVCMNKNFVYTDILPDLLQFLQVLEAAKGILDDNYTLLYWNDHIDTFLQR